MKKTITNIKTLAVASIMCFGSYTANAQCGVDAVPPASTGCGSGDAIDAFSINSIASPNSSGCSPAANGVYTTAITWTIGTGISNSFAASVGGGTWTQGLGMWIDLNNDGFYNNTNEQMFSTGPALTHAGTFTVPGTVPSGIYRMRIRCVYAATNTSACDAVTWGEAENYRIQIVPGGAALNFDGVNDMVDVGTSLNSTFPGTNKVTVEAWFNASNTSGNGVIVGNWGNPAASLQYMLRRDGANINFFVRNASGLQNVLSIATVTTGTWMHAAGTWDGAIMRVFINGLPSGTAAVTGSLQTETNPVSIGGRQGGEFFNGSIDEVRIWNRTLCQGEIQNNMMGQLSIPQTSLVAYYRFNQGLAGLANTTNSLVTPVAGPTGTTSNMALTGATSNWIAPGAVSSTTNVAAFVTPTLAIASPTSICNGSSTTLTASGASSYTWTSGPTTATFAVTPSVTTTYSVVGTATNGCLTNVTTRTINVNANPTVAVTSGTICSGSTFTMVPSGANTYTIQGGSAAVSPTANASYTVIGTNTITGCVSANTATSNVTVNALPSVTVSGNTPICGTGTNVLNASGANTYSWNTGATTNTISVSPTVTTNYTVVGTSTLTGCAQTTTLSQNVGANPTITVNSGAICAGNSFTITPSGASTYTYSGGSAVVSPTATAAYTVTGTNTVGCNGSAVSNVTVNVGPSISITGNNSICAGNSTSLTASGSSTYTWNTGATTASIVVTPTANATYTASSTGTNGCTGMAMTSVTVNALPTVSAASSNTAFICVGSSATLTASGASSYVWNTTATTAVIAVSPTTTTSYTVTGTDANGCSANAVLTQSVNTCTGIDNLSSNVSNLSFQVYPNPSNGIFNVQLENAATIEITDVLGRVILTDKVNAGNYQLNLGNNVNGVYFVKATVDGKSKTVKIVKE